MNSLFNGIFFYTVNKLNGYTTGNYKTKLINAVIVHYK